MTELEYDEHPWLNFAKESLFVEAEAIRVAAERLGPEFERAVNLLDRNLGKIITTGVGKSGIAARKIASTLTSTGAPAVFLHPSEAMHGDLGIVQTEDLILALSHSGESEELLAILPALLARGVPIIALTGNLASTLAQKATVNINAGVEREICPHNLAPTTSVVVAMALGDALAMTLQKKRGFREEDYALNHPGGRLGRRLTLRVRDLMRATPNELPSVRADTTMMELLKEISDKSFGAACVVDEAGRLEGVITDHDVRCGFQKFGTEWMQCTAGEIMTVRPAVVLFPDQLAFEALRIMEDRPRQISVAPVVDDSRHYIGIIRVHDLVRAGL